MTTVGGMKHRCVIYACHSCPTFKYVIFVCKKLNIKTKTILIAARRQKSLQPLNIQSQREVQKWKKDNNMMWYDVREETEKPWWTMNQNNHLLQKNIIYCVQINIIMLAYSSVFNIVMVHGRGLGGKSGINIYLCTSINNWGQLYGLFDWLSLWTVWRVHAKINKTKWYY